MAARTARKSSTKKASTGTRSSAKARAAKPGKSKRGSSSTKKRSEKESEREKPRVKTTGKLKGAKSSRGSSKAVDKQPKVTTKKKKLKKELPSKALKKVKKVVEEPKLRKTSRLEERPLKKKKKKLKAGKEPVVEKKLPKKKPVEQKVDKATKLKTKLKGSKAEREEPIKKKLKGKPAAAFEAKATKGKGAKDVAPAKGKTLPPAKGKTLPPEPRESKPPKGKTLPPKGKALPPKGKTPPPKGKTVPPEPKKAKGKSLPPAKKGAQSAAAAKPRATSRTPAQAIPKEPPRPSLEERAAAVEIRLQSQSEEIQRDYLDRLYMSWIHHDSALEGVVYTFAELQTAVDPNITVVPDSSIQPICDEIRRHKAAIDFVRDVAGKKKQPLTTDIIKRIYLFFHPEEGDIKTVKYRKDIPQHRLYFHEYAPPDKIAYGVRQVVEWINDPETKKTRTPIRIAARAHYDFLRVFPFPNDSGKVARLLMNYILLRAGFPPAIVHSTERQRYYDSLKGSPLAIVHMVSESLENSIASIDKYLDDRGAPRPNT